MSFLIKQKKELGLSMAELKQTRMQRLQQLLYVFHADLTTHKMHLGHLSTHNQELQSAIRPTDQMEARSVNMRFSSVKTIAELVA